VLQWTQDDATFRGAEMQFDYIVLQDAELGEIGLRLQADRVRARLDKAVPGGNRNLPRIAPGRFGLGLNWERGAWQADAMVMRYETQDKTAAFETATAGFNWIDLDFSRSFGSAQAERSLVSEVYLQIRNVGDQEARVHTSYLKDIAPLIGRNVGFGLRFYW
jgi:iron complex outermembrane recepter protein